MAKIQVTTADIKAQTEIIVLNSYFIAKVTRAYDTIDEMIDRCKQPVTKWNKETEKHEPVLDENNNPTFRYYTDGHEIETIEDRVYPLLKELMEALGIKPEVV